MAVLKTAIQIHRYTGLSTDTKPTKATHDTPAGSTFFEHDTGIMYITHDGTSWVVKDKQQLVSIATDAAAIATAVNPAVKFRLLAVMVHLSAAPTTSENFLVTLDAGDGAAYDTVLAKQDLSAGSLTDYVAIFGEGFEFEADDHIDITWTNTNARTYGLRVVYELI